MNTKEMLTENLRLNVLLYGKSGTGKTTFACSFPKPFLFDFDKGMLSQRGRDVEYETYAGVSAYQDFEVKLKELEKECPYETIILDSITTMQEYLMSKILMMNRRSQPTLHEWMAMVTELKDIFMRLTKHSKHLVVIAHERLMQDEITGEIMYVPVVVGKQLPSLLPMWFDEMYRCTVSRDKEGTPEYGILTASDVKYTARSRLGCLETVEKVSEKGKLISGYELIMGKVERGGK